MRWLVATRSIGEREKKKGQYTKKKKSIRNLVTTCSTPAPAAKSKMIIVRPILTMQKTGSRGPSLLSLFV